MIGKKGKYMGISLAFIAGIGVGCVISSIIIAVYARIGVSYGFNTGLTLLQQSAEKIAEAMNKTTDYVQKGDPDGGLM